MAKIIFFEFELSLKKQKNSVQENQDYEIEIAEGIHMIKMFP